MLERCGKLAEPVQQPCGLIIGFNLTGLKREKLPVNGKGLLQRTRFIGMFLIKPAQVQIGAGKAGG